MFAVVVATALVVGVPLAGGMDPEPATPVITGSVPPTPANDNSPTLTGTADPNTLITLYSGSCPGAVAGTGQADGSGAFAVPLTVSVADNSTTVFYATATGVSPPKTSKCSQGFTYVEDSAPPPAPVIASGPPSPSGLSTAHFTFSDAEAGVAFRCELDGGGFASCTNPQDFAVANGSHTLRVEAVDAAGNVSDPSAAYAWTVDTAHPLVALTSAPPLLTNQTTATFAFGSTPPAPYQCRLDGAAFSACTSPQPYSGLADGLHTFQVVAPSLGDVPTSYAWRVDTVAPETRIASGPPARSNNKNATFTFSSSEPNSTFSCSLDGSGFTLCASPKTYSNVKDGAHTLRVAAVDQAGNADRSAATYAWTIVHGGGTADLTPPGNVSRLRRSVGYGRLQLRWTKPRDNDYDHAEVYVSTSPKSPPRTLVYRGKGQRYTNRRFKTGAYYRYRIVSVDLARNASKGAITTIRPSVLLKSPRDQSVVHSPPLLRWAAVPKATFYNVQVWRNGTKILSAWPVEARRPLVRRWSYSGRRFSLVKGLYVWYVWPAFGSRKNPRYGQLLGQASFRVR